MDACSLGMQRAMGQKEAISAYCARDIRELDSRLRRSTEAEAVTWMALEEERERHAALQQMLVEAQSDVAHQSAGAPSTNGGISRWGRRDFARCGTHASPACSPPTARPAPSRQQAQNAAPAPNAGAGWHVSPDASLPVCLTLRAGPAATATPASRPAALYVHRPPPKAAQDGPQAIDIATRLSEPSEVAACLQLQQQRRVRREAPPPRLQLAQTKVSAGAGAAPPPVARIPSAPPWLVWCDILVRELASAESEAQDHCETAALARRAAQRAEDVQDALERRLVAMDEQLREELAASASAATHPPTLEAKGRAMPGTRGVACSARSAAAEGGGAPPVAGVAAHVGGGAAAKTCESGSGLYWVADVVRDCGTRRWDDAGEGDQADVSVLWASGAGVDMCGAGGGCRAQSRTTAAAVREAEAATEAVWHSRVSSAEQEAHAARRDAAAAQARASALVAQLEALHECVTIETRARAGAEAAAAVAEGRYAALLARLAAGDVEAGGGGSARCGGIPAQVCAGSTLGASSASPTDRLQQGAERPQRRGVPTPGTWAPASPSAGVERPAGAGMRVMDVVQLVRAASIADAWPV